MFNLSFSSHRRMPACEVTSRNEMAEKNRTSHRRLPVRVAALLLAGVLITMLAACSNDSNPSDVTQPSHQGATEPSSEKTVPSESIDAPSATDFGSSSTSDRTPQSIIESIYQVVQPAFQVETQLVDLSDNDAVKYYTGLETGEDVAEVAVSEPLMSAQAYSLVVVRVKEGVDARAIADRMKQGVDPIKWVCVSADVVEVSSNDRDVVLFMADSALIENFTVEQVIQAFDALYQ